MNKFLTAVITLLILIISFIIFSPQCPFGCGCSRSNESFIDRYQHCCCSKNENLSNRFADGQINLTRTVTLYYTSWCVFCKQIKPIWDQVKFATTNSGITFLESLEDQPTNPNITSYPTILMIDEFGHTSKFQGSPDFTDLRNWIVSPITWRQS